MDGKVINTSYIEGVDRTDYTTLIVDKDLYLSGSYVGLAKFYSPPSSKDEGGIRGSSIILESKTPQLYISKYQRAVEWVRSSSGEGSCFPRALTSTPYPHHLEMTGDDKGNIYMTGGYEGHVAIGDTILPYSRGVGLLIGSINLAGEFLWVHGISSQGSSNKIGTGIVIVKDQLILAGIAWESLSRLGLDWGSTSDKTVSNFLIQATLSGMINYKTELDVHLINPFLSIDSCFNIYLSGPINEESYVLIKLDQHLHPIMSETEVGKNIILSINSLGNITLSKNETLSYYVNTLPSPLGILRETACDTCVTVDFTGKTHALSGLIPGVLYYVDLCGKIVPKCDEPLPQSKFLGTAVSHHTLLLGL